MTKRMAGRVGLTAILAGLGAMLSAEEPATKPAGKLAPLPFTISKETTGIVSPLHEDGTPDYVAAMNEKYGKGVTPENNALVGWLKMVGTGEKTLSPKIKDKMLKMCGTEESEGMAWQTYWAYLKELGETDTAVNQGMDDALQVTKRLWAAEDFPNLAKYLEREGEYLDAAKEAFGRKRWWMPYVSSDGRTMVTVVLPSLARMRDPAWGLAGRATLRAKAGDFAGFLSDVTAIKRMAGHLGASGIIIERMMAAAIDAIADQAIGVVAGSGILSGGQCAESWKMLEGCPVMPSMIEVTDVVERWWIKDAVVLVAAGKARVLNRAFKGNEDADEGEGDEGFFKGVDVGAVNWDAVLKQMDREVDSWVAVMKQPTIDELQEGTKEMDKKRAKWGTSTENGLSPAFGETRAAYSERVGNAVFQMLAPSLFKRQFGIRLGT